MGGKVAYTLDHEDIARVERMSARGISKWSIARACGISSKTLREIEKRQPEVTDAIERGRSKLESYEPIRERYVSVGSWHVTGPGNRSNRRKIRITQREVEKMVAKTRNCCYLCGRHRDNFKRNLAVDHCHKTGRVRGLLCLRCNLLVGNIEGLMKMGVTLSSIRAYLGRDGGAPKPIARRARSARKESA
jgi:hypothetical protein